MNETLGIIILNFNGLNDTIELLESIWENVTDISYLIILVDNASDNNEADYLEAIYGNRITVLKSLKNCGYAAGNNIGIRYAIQKGIKNICILNNDTVISDDFFRDCIEYLDNDPDVAFVSPAIIDINQNVQNCGGTYYLLKGNTYYNDFGKKYEEIEKKDITCDLVFGACMIFKASLLDSIGYIPEVYFLFYEETEWCLRARNAGYRCVCLSNHFITHKGSVSIKRVSGLSEYLFERNRVLFAKRNLGKLKFLCFLVFDFCRLLYQSIHFHVRFKEYLRYHIDGLTGRIDPRFPFIWINENM